MSLIIKNRPNDATLEQELPNQSILVLRSLGMEPVMEREQFIFILHKSMMNMAAMGNEALYHEIKDTADELYNWQSEYVYLEY